MIFENKKHAFTAQHVTPQPAGTQSEKSYLRWYKKNYWWVTIANDVSRSTCSGFSPDARRRKLEKSPVWPRLEETFRLGLDVLFRFDILAQLANIPPWITIHELLHLSKETREALRDALANSESFLTHIPEASQYDIQHLCPEYHHVQLKMPAITFTAKDMLLKDNKHDRQLYYTRYIGSTYIGRVQIDPGSTLSIIP